MQQFISRFQDRIQGVVSGFDRMLFRGTLRNLGFAYGMEVHLYLNGILFKLCAGICKRRHSTRSS